MATTEIPDLKSRLDLALHAAREAERIILEYYQSSGLAVDRKKDSSPVTIADRRAEEFIRGEIAKQFPNDGILGEEFGDTPGTSGFRWILDPLDGTKSFIHGVPLFGTLIGVEISPPPLTKEGSGGVAPPAEPGQCVIGVCHFPILHETAWAAAGQGAWWQSGNNPPQKARVSAVADMSQALFSFTTVQGFDRIGRPDAFADFIKRANLSRGWGDCYGHILVATGRAEFMVDPLMNPWDCAALLPIVQEAGGHFMDWNGNASIYSGNGISVNAALRDEVLRITKR